MLQSKTTLSKIHAVETPNIIWLFHCLQAFTHLLCILALHCSNLYWYLCLHLIQLTKLFIIYFPYPFYDFYGSNWAVIWHMNSCWTGVWSPSLKSPSNITEDSSVRNNQEKKDGEDAPPVVWTPKSAGASPTSERKEFRPINFESPPLPRKTLSATFSPATFKPADVSFNWLLTNSYMKKHILQFPHFIIFQFIVFRNIPSLLEFLFNVAV
jgi:hypothetical protein